MSGSGGPETLIQLLPGVQNAEHALALMMGKPIIGDGPIHFTHVLMAGTVFVGAVGLTLRAGFYRVPADQRVLPEDRPSVRALFEVAIEGLLALATDLVGPKHAASVLPLVGTLGVFICMSNLLGLVPGFVPPTDTLNTTVACAIPVFFGTHYFGLREHGVRGYLKHFVGPSPFLAPLMVPIEIVSHISRPVSLSLRLFGNMMGDHKVLAIFIGLFPLLVPLPVLVLGVVVSLVQTLVFCLLSMVYIGLAVAHEEQ